MKNNSTEDFIKLETKWHDTMTKPNGMQELKLNNWKILIDGMLAEAVSKTELTINFFQQFGTMIDANEYKALRSAWEKFKKAIDV